MRIARTGITKEEVGVAEALSDIAYRLITKKLMAAELLAGQKISEQSIASECGISRTPVREAVRRLTEEGVLYQVPSSGTARSRPSPQAASGGS